MNDLSKRVLVINIALSQLIIIGIALILIHTVFKEIDFFALWQVEINLRAVVVVLLGSMVLLALQLLVHRYVKKEHLFDEINRIIMDKFTLPELFLIFLTGSLAEEFLFRGVLQTELGLVAASILFTLTHFRYIKKYFILLEVFVMGLILGLTYALTEILWVPIACHLAVNFATAVLVKTGYLELDSQATEQDENS